MSQSRAPLLRREIRQEQRQQQPLKGFRNGDEDDHVSEKQNKDKAKPDHGCAGEGGMTPEKLSRWKMKRRGGKRPLTVEEVERRRQAGIAEYRAKNPDWRTKNRNWSEPVKEEYMRQAKRKKCQGKTPWGTDCPAMASPSGSGFCSTHELQGMQVGDTVSTVRTCQLCKRNPVDPENETNYCRSCYESRWATGRRIAAGEDVPQPGDIDYDGLPGSVDDL